MPLLSTLNSHTHIHINNDNLVITADEIGLSLAMLLNPNLDATAYAGDTEIRLPLAQSRSTTPALIATLTAIETGVPAPTVEIKPMGKMLSLLTISIGKTKEQLNSIINSVPRTLPPYSPSSPDFPPETSNADKFPGIPRTSSPIIHPLPQPSSLIPFLLRLCNAAALHTGLPQRRFLPDGLRVDLLYLPSHADSGVLNDDMLPFPYQQGVESRAVSAATDMGGTIKLQISHLDSFPGPEEWALILKHLPWRIEPFPEPNYARTKKRHFLYADLPNPP